MTEKCNICHRETSEWEAVNVKMVMTPAWSDSTGDCFRRYVVCPYCLPRLMASMDAAANNLEDELKKESHWCQWKRTYDELTHGKKRERKAELAANREMRKKTVKTELTKDEQNFAGGAAYCGQSYSEIAVQILKDRESKTKSDIYSGIVMAHRNYLGQC